MAIKEKELEKSNDKLLDMIQAKNIEESFLKVSNQELKLHLELLHGSLRGNVQTKKSLAKLMDKWRENGIF